MKLALFLVAVIGLFFGVLMLDNSVHGGATWWSYAVGVPAFLFVLAVVVRAVYNGLKPKSLNDKAGPGAALLVLALASSLLSCQSVPTATRPATATEIATAEQLFPAPEMVTDSGQWTHPKLVAAH